MTQSFGCASVSGWAWLPVTLGFRLDASLISVAARTLR